MKKYLIASLFIFILFFNLNIVSAEITNEILLNGNQNIIMEAGQDFHDPKATFNETIVEPDKTITKDTLPGLYIINYVHTEGTTTYSAKRYVEVTKPLELIANFTFNNFIKNNYSLYDLKDGVVLNDGSLLAYKQYMFYRFNNKFTEITTDNLTYSIEKMIPGYDDEFIAVGSYGTISKYNKDGEFIKSAVPLGSTSYDTFYDVIKTNDGNFIAIGNIYNGPKKAFLVKFDNDLNIIFNEAYLVNSYYDYNQIAQTSDGGYIAISDNVSQSPNLLKFDMLGVFEKEIPVVNNIIYTSIKTLPDGNVLLTGQINNNPYFHAINSSGETVWETTMHELDNSIINDFILNDANEIIAVGTMTDLYTNLGIMVKLNSAGEKIQYRINNGEQGALYKIIKYSSNKYITFGDYDQQISRIIDNGLKDLNLFSDTSVKRVNLFSEYDELSIFNSTTNLNIEVNTPIDYLNKAGTHNILYTITFDNFTYYLNRKVIVEDKEAPVISGLKESFILEAGSTSPNYTDGVSATDNSLENIQVTYDDSLVDLDKVGEYYVTYSAKDSSNNEKIEKVLVKIVDTIPPVINSVDTLTLEASKYKPIWKHLIEITDNSKDELLLEINDENILYSQVGEYDITVSVTDKGNNTSTKAIHLVIIDTTKPKLKKYDLTYEVLQNAPNWNEFLPITDNSNDTLEITVDDSEVNYNKIGIYKIHFTAADTSENVLDDYFNFKIVDTQKPIIIINLEKQTLKIKRKAPDPDFLSFISATDNYTPKLKIEIDDSKVNYSKAGKYEVKIQVEDESNNLAEETMYIIVEKTTLDITLEIGIPLVFAIFVFGSIISIIKKLDGKYVN